MEEGGSILAVCSPFLPLHTGSQQASHTHWPSSLRWPAPGAPPGAGYFWILVPGLCQVGNGEVVSAFPSSSYWVWRLRLWRAWEFAYKMLGLHSAEGYF